MVWLGVAHPLTVASVSVTPADLPLSVEYPAEPLLFASAAVGVGLADTKPAKLGRIAAPSDGDWLLPYSVAVGVGHDPSLAIWSRLGDLRAPPFPLLLPSTALGVGHDPNSVSPVRGSDMASTHHERPCGVVCCLQIAEHFVSCDSSEARDVLSEHPTGS